jgi:hypothetical protein
VMSITQQANCDVRHLAEQAHRSGRAAALTSPRGTSPRWDGVKTSFALMAPRECERGF